MGHDPAATGSGMLLIKPPKQTGSASPLQTLDKSREAPSEEAKRFTSHTDRGDDTDPVSQPRAGHP
ncbi:hypothetical protein GCM10011591_39280 [Nocardia camponoti]|uniref:Uncharacterized protein n=1 Tax=Nocardia camponoti TaxID=1616106 RepID=A0A917QR78_9NOCA|nr:hypothetical protein GCM10011591_39280 [Nocardia camponoti]